MDELWAVLTVAIAGAAVVALSELLRWRLCQPIPESEVEEMRRWIRERQAEKGGG